MDSGVDSWIFNAPPAAPLPCFQPLWQACLDIVQLVCIRLKLIWSNTPHSNLHQCQGIGGGAGHSTREGGGSEWDASIGGLRALCCQVSVPILNPKAAADRAHKSPWGSFDDNKTSSADATITPCYSAQLLCYLHKPFPSRWLAWLLALRSIIPLSASVGSVNRLITLVMR